MNLTEIVTGRPLDYLPTEYEEALARRWGKANGYLGQGGGWINGPDGRTFCQGWWNLWRRRQGQIIQSLVDEYTAWGNFTDFLRGSGTTYRPTLLVRGVRDWPKDALACIYDSHMRKAGDPRRVYRGARDGMTPEARVELRRRAEAAVRAR